jgi:hypothetical protein
MANAKQCDICGRYYNVPEIDEDAIFRTNMNSSMVRILRHKPKSRTTTHDVMQFDSCDKCLQDVLDYILTRKATSKIIAK